MENGRQGGALLRLNKGAKRKEKKKKTPGISLTELFLFMFFVFYLLDLIIFQIEPHNNTTRTRMYLLSVYYLPATFLATGCGKNKKNKKEKTSLSAAVHHHGAEGAEQTGSTSS